jgi:hypothetical protein
MKSLLAIACVLLSGCASISGPTQDATLVFARTSSNRSFPGGIEQIDGVANATGNRTVSVTPGRRTVTYLCPDVLVMDSHPTVEAIFEAGKVYELVCTGTLAEIRLQGNDR